MENHLASFYRIIKERLVYAGIAQPALDARLLICHALGLSHEEFILQADRLLSSDDINTINTLAAQRLQRMPIAKIIGTKEFYGRDFITTIHTLDPRPDSEILIETLLKNNTNPAPVILDLGTGTGCLLLTLLAEIPGATGVGVDQSNHALAVAEQNARALNVINRTNFLHSDWLEKITGRYDIIISNPPYIPDADRSILAPELAHDPETALFGGADGLDPYRHIIPLLPGFLNNPGFLAFEVGRGQALQVAEMMGLNGFESVAITPDLAGIGRVVSGVCRK